MQILFVRHGESQANILHEISNRGLRHGLTRNGRLQVLKLAQTLLGLPITHLFSSPLLRAIETSVILAGQLDLDYEVTDALREYDCGILEGRADDNAWLGWQELFDAWVLRGEYDRRIEGGESFFDIQRRFEFFIDYLIKRHSGSKDHVVCVSHGGIYWMMLPVVLRNVNTKLISRYGFDYSTCISAELRSDGLFCVDWNGKPIDPVVD